jgi:hypothetical protein
MSQKTKTLETILRVIIAVVSAIAGALGVSSFK